MKINEVVIDASDKFKGRQDLAKQQRGKDFVKKLTNVVGSVPGMFDRQKELEKIADDELSKIEKYPNRVFNDDRAQLAPVLTWFQPGISVITALEFSTDNDAGLIDGPHEERVKQTALNFIHLNIDKIFDTIDEQLEMMITLRDKLNKLKWYAPWERYTRYRYVLHDIHRSKEFFQKFRTLA